MWEWVTTEERMREGMYRDDGHCKGYNDTAFEQVFHTRTPNPSAPNPSAPNPEPPNPRTPEPPNPRTHELLRIPE